MKHLLILITLFCGSEWALGQSFVLPVRQNAMGNVKAVAFKASLNPVANIFTDGFSGFASVENRFVETNIQGFALGGGYTSSLGHFQLGINRLGLPGFFQQEVAVGYGHRLGKKGAIGLNALYFSRKADHYETTGSFSFAISTQFPLSENVQAGILLSNPLADKSNEPTYNYDGELAIGVQWTLTKLTSVFEISKPQHTRYAMKVGVDYRPAKVFSIMGGVVVTEFDLRPSLGIGYQIKGIELVMSSAYYNQLAPGISFGIIHK